VGGDGLAARRAGAQGRDQRAMIDRDLAPPGRMTVSTACQRAASACMVPASPETLAASVSAASAR
jgi:hypothetical protein